MGKDRKYKARNKRDDKKSQKRTSTKISTKTNTRTKTKTCKIVDVGGGGDCFYRVVAHQLKMNPNKFMEIRRKIADYLEANKETYQPFFENNEKLTKFISSIRKKGKWCEGEIEMQAVCNIFNVNLDVYGDSGEINKFTTE